jgi:predicted transcriptional regulator
VGPLQAGRSYESGDDIVGSVHERGLLDRVFCDRDAVSRSVAEVMDEAMP